MSLSLELYKKLYLIRQAENAILKYYPENDMTTPMHMSMGQEAVSVGVCQAMEPQDQVMGSYRSHALFLAKTGDTDQFFAEMYGRETSPMDGKAGSMHMSDPESGMLASSAIVSSTIPIILGVAYANKMKKNGLMAAVFFGDGATDEGVFWESVNVAALKKLPVIFVCEDNGYAVNTPGSERQAFSSLTEIVAKFGWNVLSDDSNNVENIFHLTREAISMIRNSNKPCLLDIKCYRYLEHCGVNEDFNDGYRSKEEYMQWMYEKDSIKLQRNKLLGIGISEVQIINLENNINEQVNNSVKKAKDAKLSDVSSLYKGIYV